MYYFTLMARGLAHLFWNIFVFMVYEAFDLGQWYKTFLSVIYGFRSKLEGLLD
jgi:hypothetical protein